MNPVETVTNHQCQDDIEIYKEVFNDIYEHYKINKTMNKNELISILPKYLTKSNTVKYKMIKDWRSEVTEKEFIKLLMTQTTGADYPNFYYFILKYDLKLDSNNMIVFNDNFHFDNKIKKEALFNWSILDLLRKDDLIKEFYEFMNFELQFNCESQDVEKTRQLKYDMMFKNLNIIVEIDENHASKKTVDNDIRKNIVSQMNGFVLVRLDFQKIYYKINKNSKKIGCGELKDGSNADKHILNSEYYNKFIHELRENIYSSMLSRKDEFRERYILFLLENSLNDRIKNIQKSVNNNSLEHEKYNTLLKNTKDLKLKQKYKNIKDELHFILDSNYKNLTKTENVLKIITDKNGKFIELFKIKNDSYQKNKSRNCKNIPLSKIIDLLSLDDNSMIKFIRFLYNIGVVNEFYHDKKDILISWRDVSEIIKNYNDIMLTLKEALNIYYLELEESYEIIINKMNDFNNKIIATQEKYRFCMQNERSKKEKAYLNEIQVLRNKFNTVNTMYNISDQLVKSLRNSYIDILSNDNDHIVNHYLIEYIFKQSPNDIKNIKKNMLIKYRKQIIEDNINPIISDIEYNSDYFSEDEEEITVDRFREEFLLQREALGLEVERAIAFREEEEAKYKAKCKYINDLKSKNNDYNNLDDKISPDLDNKHSDSNHIFNLDDVELDLDDELDVDSD